MTPWQPRHRRTRHLAVRIAAAVIAPALVAGGVYATLGDDPDTTTVAGGPNVEAGTSSTIGTSPVEPRGSGTPASTPSPSASATSPENSADDPTTPGASPSATETVPETDGDDPTSPDSPSPDPDPSSSPTSTPSDDPSPSTPPRVDPSTPPNPDPDPDPDPDPNPSPSLPPHEPPNEPPPVVELVKVEQSLADAANDVRGSDCPDLRVDGRLTAAARAHSADMHERGFFSHENPDGETPEDRAADAGYTEPGGENLSWGLRSPKTVILAWMLLPEQRSNLLDCDYRAIGVGYEDGPGGPWWTLMFGYE
ncbi:MAG TPA: CAP domain-containing protein [Jiangellaceae bacterium]